MSEPTVTENAQTQATGERLGEGTAPPTPPAAQTSSTAAPTRRTKKELLCTICGLKACWQKRS
jgi:hypothetical protein